MSKRQNELDREALSAHIATFIENGGEVQQIDYLAVAEPRLILKRKEGSKERCNIVSGNPQNKGWTS